MFVLFFLILFKFIRNHSLDDKLGSIYTEQPIIRVAKIFYNLSDIECEKPLITIYTDYHEETFPEPIEIQNPIEFCIRKITNNQRYQPVWKCKPMEDEEIFKYQNKVICFKCKKFNGLLRNEVEYFTPVIGQCYYSREKPGYIVKYVPRKTQMIDNDNIHVLDLKKVSEY
jgi:hypothetical protein